MTILQPSDGIAATPEDAENLENAGYTKCYNPKCNFFISPDGQQKAMEDGGYYTCPKRECYQSHDLLHEMPWHGADEDSGTFSSGGGTRIGISMEEQAQIGEDLIRGLNSLPGYGPIMWWHPGGAGTPSPLDGTTKDWGIEVKTIGYDAIHHRFIPGSTKEKSAKDSEAENLGLRGVLGILVLLNYKTSIAQVFVKEMPNEGWTTGRGRKMNGIATFRKNTAQHLLENVPFKNPLMDPHNPAPHSAEPPF